MYRSLDVEISLPSREFCNFVVGSGAPKSVAAKIGNPSLKQTGNKTISLCAEHFFSVPKPLMATRAQGKTDGKSKQALQGEINRLKGRLSKAQPKQRLRRPNFSRLLSMPAPSSMPRGVMPDMTKGNWGQTPATSNTLAPRGFGYYDAFAHDPFSVATYQSIGPATPIVGTTICNQITTKKPAPLTTSALESGAILLIVFPALTNTQAVAYSCSSLVDADIIHSLSYNSPQLAADQPDAAIATRCSMRIRNWTQAIGVGGIVRVLRMTTGVGLLANPTGTDNQTLAELQESIRVHTRTRTYGGEELQDTQQKNCTVVDQSRATAFDYFGNTTSTDTWIRNDTLPWTAELGWEQDPAIAGGKITQFTAGLHNPAFTPIAILFEPFVYASTAGSSGNTYEVNVRSQFLAHYEQGTMLANMAIDPPTDANGMNKHRNTEESKGSTLENIANSLKSGGEYAWQHKADIIPAGYAAYKFAAPLLRGMPKGVP